MNPKYEAAFKPFIFRSGVEIKNRITMAPISTQELMKMVKYQTKKLRIIKNVPVV
ncbi:hypothetical protein [Peribacillus sp. R9-11]|uniref:hypothetical protein n=1 Tax=Peribacillus sp. R9-11 TaxID=3073271 RepID=UPI0037C77FB9